ncbi:MAG: outer membrane lipoprotein carrier protein LolA [Deltaproteobacteria bacterium]|nr:outer membrane lipoprotein carrier protein LolA [Deltaproteobacteria bacterium]
MLWLAALALSLSPIDTLSKVQATYKQGGDFEASFTHVYIDKLRGKKRLETGKLWAKRDGRVRWSYLDPVPKDFVFTGKQAIFYEPEAAQVTLFEAFEDSPLFEATRFLWGQGRIDRLFDAKTCSTHCDLGGAGEIVIELWPKQELASIDHTVLIVDAKAFRVLRSIIFDTLGNRTEYVFSAVKFGAKISGKKFDFVMPQGVSILRAGAENP